MFNTLLHKIVNGVARIHQYILALNNTHSIPFTDKQLHFLVIGFIGIGLLIVVYPVFKWLAKKKLVMAIAWIYVLTILVALTLAIEVGQKITGTGDMEFKDIVAGILGFFVFSIIFEIGRVLILPMFKKEDNNKE